MIPARLLIDLVEPVAKADPARSAPRQTFPYIDLGSVDQRHKAITGVEELLGSEAPSRARQVVSSGDVLVSTVRPNLNGVAKVPPHLEGAIASTGFTVLRPRPDVLNGDYLFHWVRSEAFVSAMTRRATGASYPAVSDNIVKGSEIPLPPIEEQRRIAAILDQADELRAKRRTSLALLDSLTESIFVDMFGDPVANPMGWPLRTFSEVCPTRLGKMLDQKHQTGLYQRPYLRNANVRWFGFDLTDLAEMDFSDADRDEFKVEPGDLLICEGGEPGRAAVWDGSVRDIYFQKALHRGRPNRSQVTATYLTHLLWHLARGGGLSDHISSATIAHLTGERLKAMMIPVPDVEVQRRFEARLSAIEVVRDSVLHADYELDALFGSLRHRAFSGAL